MRYGISSVLGILHVLPAVLSAQHVQLPSVERAARRTSAAITAADLVSRLHVLAEDSTHAGGTEPSGGVKGTARIGRALRSLGLMTAGEHDTYFQSVPFVARRLSRQSAISVNNVLMTAFADFTALPFRGSSAGALDGVQAVYGGVYGDSLHAITGAQAAGKLVVMMAPKGLGHLASNSPLQRAAGIAIAGGDALSPDVLAQSRGAVYTLKNVADGVAEPVIVVVTKLSATQLVGGALDGMPVGTLGHVIAAGLIFDETPAPARNIVAVLPGSDPALRGEFVAIGARLAANALGAATMLEVAEAFAKGRSKPRRSILFVWHAGDEKGMLGSRFFTDNPTVTRDSIVAQIDIDMAGRGALPHLSAGGERDLQLVGSRRLSTELGDLTESVNRGLSMPFALDNAYDANAHPANIYCRSDHFNYARYGIPAVLLTSGLRWQKSRSFAALRTTKSYHVDAPQVKGEPLDIDYQHMAHVGQFAFELARRVADLDHRPVLDKPRPDPLAACRQ